MAPAPSGAMANTIAEELRARTFRYALRIIVLCRKLPDTWEAHEMGRQLLRSGMGTASNYWSACRSRSGNEFIARLGIAADEAAESVLWLMLIVQSGVRTETDAKDVLAEGREITAILSASLKTAKENRRKKKNQLTKLPTNQITN
jgi:four helix bundle protein